MQVSSCGTLCTEHSGYLSFFDKARNVSKSLEFTNLPLAEVACRFVFPAPANISTPQWLDIMQRTTSADFVMHDQDGDTFEILPDRQPLIQPMTINKLAFSHRKTDVLVRVQRDLVASRWDTTLHRPYPRFRALATAVTNAYQIIREVLGDEVKPAMAMIIYVNRILVQGTTFSDAVNRYISSDVLPAAVRSNLLHYDIEWRKPNSAVLRLHVLLGPSTHQDVPDAMLLVTSANISVGEGAEPSQALEDIHGELQQMFLMVISNEARMEWGYVG